MPSVFAFACVSTGYRERGEEEEEEEAEEEKEAYEVVVE